MSTNLRDLQYVTMASSPPGETQPVALTFCCPKCQRTSRLHVGSGVGVVCPSCGWQRPAAGDDFAEGKPAHCLVCGCHDLWRQKNFSARAGLLMVGSAILLSTIAYAFWQPLLSLGVLMAFALIDAVLYLFMRDVAVCYRCGARHAGFEPAHATFDLEVAERYRQERLRHEKLTHASS